MKKEITVNVAVLLLVLAVYLTLNVVPYLEILRALSDVHYQGVIRSLLIIIGILEMVLFVKSGRGKEYGRFQFRWSYLGAVLLSFFLFFVWDGISNVLFPLAQNTVAAEENSIELTGLVFFLLNFIYPVFIGPIVEEFLCRGLVMTSLSSYRRFGIDLIISSSVFSLGHILQHGWVTTDFIRYFIPGLIFGALFRYTRSIVWPIAAHILWNAFVFVMVFL